MLFYLSPLISAVFLLLSLSYSYHPYYHRTLCRVGTTFFEGDRKGRPYHTTKWLTRPVYGRGDHVLDKSALYGGRPGLVAEGWPFWDACHCMVPSENGNR